MIDLTDLEISEELKERLKRQREEVEAIRREGPLDSSSLVKLHQHFRTMHVYHSAGIEGNRLSLQETRVVLEEAIDISGKPLRDSLEVRNLGQAFDFFSELAKSGSPIRETDIRTIHQILLSREEEKNPGAYRQKGVVITGAEHTPPEPMDVPVRMAGLVQWINENEAGDPTLLASISHHELTAVHPFEDGNGRVGDRPTLRGK